jgi:hypothetical protein
MPPRTFTLDSPHMTGDDIRQFQSLLNERFENWEIGKRIGTDGDYGSETRIAARQVCKALGILHEHAMKHGVTPELRIKIRNPDKRTEVEIERSKSGAIKRYRARLRRNFASRVVIAPGANKPGQPISEETLDFVKRMSVRCRRKIVITTGTNHSKFTSSGSISDHFTGHAVDLGMIGNGGTNDGPVGDALMAAALVLAGLSPQAAKAQAKAGGLITRHHKGMRIQCIWKTDDHHDHVHVAARPE